jgi:hypothetical protein
MFATPSSLSLLFCPLLAAEIDHHFPDSNAI